MLHRHICFIPHPAVVTPVLPRWPKIPLLETATAMLPCVEAKAAQVERLLDYTFSNKRLAAEALQMAAPQIASLHNNHFASLDNNKRLFVLGEMVLGSQLCSAWFKYRGPHGKEASLLLVGYVAQQDRQAVSCLQHNGPSCAMTSSPPMPSLSEATALESTSSSSGPMARLCHLQKMVATALGPIIGAVHEDAGDEAVHTIMQRLGFFDHVLLSATLQFLHFQT